MSITEFIKVLKIRKKKQPSPLQAEKEGIAGNNQEHGKVATQVTSYYTLQGQHQERTQIKRSILDYMGNFKHQKSAEKQSNNTKAV
eukprot:15365735-Ditylum_brightwellii.AAC.1